MSEEEWTFMATDVGDGMLRVAMYEITPDKANHERKSIRLELDVAQMSQLFETCFRALEYHLRLMR